MVSKKRRVLFSAVWGLLFGFFYVAGHALDTVENVNFLDKMFYIKWLLGAVLSGVVLYFLWEGIHRFRSLDKYRSRLRNFDVSFLTGMLVMLICWLPVLLSIFPGAFSYDALDEWQQVAGGELTAHHPVLHVLLLGGLVEGGYQLTGSYNVGIAVYSLVQMIGLAAVFSYTLRFLKEYGVPGIFRLPALLFYCFSPIVGLFSICATKDTLFTAVLLLFFLYVVRIFTDKEAFFMNKKHLTGFAASALGTMILRNNGLYVVLIVGAVICILCRKYLKRYLPYVLAVLLVYGVYTGPFYSILDVTPGGKQEMLSVPIQQLARVYKYDYATLSQEDLNILYEYLPRESLVQYRSTVSDFVKKGFNGEAFAENPAGFFKLWLKWGLEHPFSYINSFLVGTVDFWYPHAIVDGYQDVYGKSSLFDYQVDEPGQERVLLPALHEWLEELSHDKEAQSKPFVFLLISPGWYLVLTLIISGYFWCYRWYQFMVPLLIPAILLFTVLLGPIALVRYVLILYFVFPVLLALMLNDIKVQNLPQGNKR